MGRRFEHPEWCTADRRCGLGEHRSEPWPFRRRYGALILTGVRTEVGDQYRDNLEVVGNVRLDHGLREIRQLVVALDMAIWAVKTQDPKILERLARVC